MGQSITPRITYARVLALAWPASVAAMITPLLGLVDATVLGYSARPLDVGAVGLASAIFSLAYWTFGFLRMSTSGLSAQAAGARDEAKARRILVQSVGLGGAIGLVLVLLQWPFGELAFWGMTRGATVAPETIDAARDYYTIRIWGAPFALMTYGLLGWLTGRGQTGKMMAVSVSLTLINAVLDVIFVLVLDWGAAGVAAGTLIAETAGAILGLTAVGVVLARNDGLAAHWREIDYFARRSLKRLLAVNLDIFIRTLILVVAIAWFIQRSAVYGDYVLSANQVLFQFFLVTGLVLDGGAIAAETLTGQALGAPQRRMRKVRFTQTVVKSCVISAIAAIALSLGYLALGGPLLDLAAPDRAINATAHEYFGWIMISPIVVATAFQLDGIYIGATRSRALRDSMIISGALYVGAVLALTAAFDNHGLWLAFGVFLLARAATLIGLWGGFRKLIDHGLAED